ncbi:MarR family winged helix-turn-helix transcriptional regulator [uncultured Erythrobacter sp.]|uniref:MarR family winged helix-turn-helix transcriptional regulator n=1 Tax=uncultured Erythrobacter sp. TaxID=263913 RepID=UPI0026595DF6|nr:MarR family winged helix-turn-helix transcriptional regulator [uncultured Erythrobacter sp.]
MIEVPFGLGIVGTDAVLVQGAVKFRSFADELIAIAARIRSAADDGVAVPLAADIGSRSDSRSLRPSRSHIVLARRIYALRRKRQAIFGIPDLFGEPAWDILLDLFIAQGEGKSVSVSSACIGSAAPPTTGLRWLGVLANEGLVLRENDADDHRRVLVRLTPAGIAAMERFFDAVEGD